MAWVTHFVPAEPARVQWFKDHLGRCGFVEGSNVETRIFNPRISGDRDDDTHLREAVAWKPDVIRTNSTAGVRAALRVAGSIPIVFARVNDPVASGLVASIRRPGGNLTGVMVHQAMLTSKRLEVLRELLPRARRVALIFETTASAINGEQAEGIRASAAKLGLALEELDPSREPKNMAGVFEKAASLGVDAVVSLVDARTGPRDGPEWAGNALVPRVVRWQREHRIPVVAGQTELVDLGLVIGVGPSWKEEWELAAELTAQVLRGENPAEIAVQQVHRIQLAVNLRAARELGIPVPKSLLQRADKVVE